MCCFSGPVESVQSTKIFTSLMRMGDGEMRQNIVYQMEYSAKQALSMVLPLPVAAEGREKAVTFVNLKKHEDFFQKLSGYFPVPLAGPGKGRGSGKAPVTPLPVEKVGNYEASYVPTIKDFSRLDARFRLPDGVWEKLPQYADYGFAVFKLQSGNLKVHPMALHFRPATLKKGHFFPTVHIHDGQVHEEEEFDHILYTQASSASGSLMSWEESSALAGAYANELPARLLNPAAHLHKKILQGKLKNQDTWV